jgi:hypothetical protein
MTGLGLKYSNFARASTQRIGSVQCQCSLGSVAGEASFANHVK